MEAKEGVSRSSSAKDEKRGGSSSQNKEGGEPKATVYGPYEISKAIGKGKFAIVYRAKRIDDGEVVALKRISVDTVDEKTRDKCLKEIKLVQSLDHPNIIRYLDSFLSDNDLVIVFEWAAAGDLKRQLRKAQEREVRFEERICWKYFSQIADAIQHMHEKRIMHRDLKPANIFLTLDGTIKVGDLGLSRELSEHTVQAHSKVGTPLYMSPEVLRGDGYDFKSDVWSLGCLLYELAMLKSPFKSEGLNLYALFQKISNGDYQLLPSEYSEELTSLTYSMISTNAVDRPDVGHVCEVAGSQRKLYADRRAARSAARAAAAAAAKTNIASSSGGPGVDCHQDKSHSQVQDAHKGVPSPGSPVHSRPEETIRRPFGGAGEGVMAVDMSPEQAAGRSGSERDNFNDSGWAVIGNGNMDTPPSANRSRKMDSGCAGSESSVPANGLGGSGSGRDDAGSAGDGHSENHDSPQHQHQHQHQPNTSTSVDRQNAQTLAYANYDATTSGGGGGQGGGIDASARLRPGGSTPANQRTERIKEGSRLFGVMEVLYDKLLVLRRLAPSQLCSARPDESANSRAGPDLDPLGTKIFNRPPLMPFHFACDIGLFGPGRAFPADVSGPGQYRKMVDVAVWLSELARPGMSPLGASTDVDMESPATVARRILKEAEACGVPRDLMNDVSVPALSKGSGEAVIVLLTAMADCALTSCVHKWRPMRYPIDMSGDEAEGGHNFVDDDHESILEESLEAAGADGDDAGYSGFHVGHDRASASQSEVGAPGRIELSTGIDERGWVEETERVTPALLAAQTRSVLGDGWRGHCDSVGRLSRTVRSAVSAGGECVGSNSSSSSSGSADHVGTNLRCLVRDLAKDLETLRRGEGLINSSATKNVPRDAYGSLKTELSALQKRQVAVSTSVEELSEKFAELTEALDGALQALDAKTESGGAGATGQVVRYKDAIRALQEEMSEMTIRAGVLGTALLRKRQEHSDALGVRRRILRDANKRRQQSGKRAESAYPEGDSDDDWGL